jgi:hypothetical protein
VTWVFPEASVFSDEVIGGQSHMSETAEPTYLYHYTTAEGLKGIIEGREIWATSIFYLNDWQEFFHGRNVFLGQARRRRSKTEGEDYERWHDVIARLKRRGPKDRPHPFVCSFSIARKGDDLSQWRAYCPNGGYAIGFDREKLKAIATYSRFELHECCYDKRSFRYDTKELFDEDLGLPPGSAGAAVKMAYMAARWKHRSFSDEKEWRLISSRYMTRVKPRFRVRGNLLVPYIPVSLEDQDLWTDVQIVMGPCSRENEDLRVESVTMLLESQVEQGNLPSTCTKNVRPSTIPYRAGMGG